MALLEMISTPDSATARTFSIVTPPEASNTTSGRIDRAS
jgi:hypothetical protein